LARTAGLGREESARRAGDLLARLGLAHASAMSLHALSRGNAQAIRSVQPAREAPSDVAGDDLAQVTVAAPRRAGVPRRMLYGAAHRARLLASSQWFLAPGMLFLVVLGNTPMGPLLRLSTHPTTLQTPAGGPAAWLVLPGLVLVAAAAFAATRVSA
jgi:hypothetical protein